MGSSLLESLAATHFANASADHVEISQASNGAVNVGNGYRCEGKSPQQQTLVTGSRQEGLD
jgi:hypothetical protein